MLDALHGAVRASNPEMNPKEILKGLLNTAEEKLKSNQYDPDNITKILHLIYSIDDNEECIGYFHRIPNKILQVYASSMPSELEPVMGKYKKAIDEVIVGYPFGFAEAVAGKMVSVFKNTNSSKIKKHSIIIVLLAGRRLNRWSAMGDFDQLLKSIQIEPDAYEVADGLREVIYDYKEMYDRIPKKELHPAIQIVWEQCEKEMKQEQEEF
ncbi:hypothetical protein [Neobacillus drentensis]|uniref:hypothetical protein n=1 Tax=Neobacillus drentensis TaxID=220684 RepID=UPI002FFFF525